MDDRPALYSPVPISYNLICKKYQADLNGPPAYIINERLFNESKRYHSWF